MHYASFQNGVCGVGGIYKLKFTLMSKSPKTDDIMSTVAWPSAVAWNCPEEIHILSFEYKRIRTMDILWMDF